MGINDKIEKPWGTIYPDGKSHNTITNDKSHDGPGCHNTTEVIGGVKIRQDILPDGTVGPVKIN